MKPPMPSEHAEQVALFQWTATQYRKYPELKLLYAIPNGGHRHIATAKRMKAEGVRAGVPDLHLPVARNGHIGLWIEMKRKGSKPRESQLEWLTELAKYGHKCVVAYSWLDAVDAIKGYLKLGGA